MFSWFKSNLKLLKDVEDLRRRVDKIETEWEKIQYEWNDWYERFHRLHMKLSKREERANGLATSEAAQTEGGATAVPGAPLTARSALIARQVAEIKRQRGGG